MITLAQPQPDTQALESTVLVQCAISRRPSSHVTCEFEVGIYADLVKIKRQAAKIKRQQVLSHSTRGKVTHFSRKSRKRMIEQLAKLRSVDQGFFATPTYPDDVEHSGEKAKRDLQALQKRIQRRFPNAGGLWRIEIKPRLSGAFVGQLAPHFHILLFGIQMHEVIFRRWFERAWSEIVYETDRPPRRVRTRVDAIRNRKHAARYASKYAAKEESADDVKIYEIHKSEMWGRRWGNFGALDFACQMTITITGDRVVELRRMIARWMHARGSRYSERLARGSPHQGFTALGLGDLSIPENDLWNSTVVRMIFA